MHAYLIVGKGQKEVEEEIEKLIKKLGAQKFEQELKSIKEVRALSSVLKITYEKPLAIIARNIDEASHEAMNSFLKSLEEPRDNIYFIMTTSNVHKILPTIRSRTQIINVQGNIKIDKDLETLANKFIEGKIGERLSIIDGVRGREDARTFFIALSIATKNIYSQKILNEKDFATLVREIDKSIENLNQNANVNLTLLNFLVKTNE